MKGELVIFFIALAFCAGTVTGFIIASWFAKPYKKYR
jgi:uncharacterized protein YneF (UPF0154 family)